jgi:hypothetical protein
MNRLEVNRSMTSFPRKIQKPRVLSPQFVIECVISFQICILCLQSSEYKRASCTRKFDHQHLTLSYTHTSLIHSYINLFLNMSTNNTEPSYVSFGDTLGRCSF